jgi:hypothetical protein
MLYRSVLISSALPLSQGVKSARCNYTACPQFIRLLMAMATPRVLYHISAGRFTISHSYPLIQHTSLHLKQKPATSCLHADFLTPRQLAVLPLGLTHIGRFVCRVHPYTREKVSASATGGHRGMCTHWQHLNLSPPALLYLQNSPPCIRSSKGRL